MPLEAFRGEVQSELGWAVYDSINQMTETYSKQGGAADPARVSNRCVMQRDSGEAQLESKCPGAKQPSLFPRLSFFGVCSRGGPATHP